MTDHAFNHAQARYDAAEPDDDEPEARPAEIELSLIVRTLVASGAIDESDETRPLSDRQATVAVWIDGREYSLTLNRED